jgi:hypothetical protein
MVEHIDPQVIIDPDLRKIAVNGNVHGHIGVDSKESLMICHGQSYLSTYYWAAGLNVVQDLLMITPSENGHLEWNAHITTVVETEYQVYIAPTYSSPGTPMARINRNLNFPLNASKILTYHTPTVTDPGTPTFQTRWGTGQKIGGAPDRLPILLEYDQAYLFRVTSRSSSNYITFEHFWTEE